MFTEKLSERDAMASSGIFPASTNGVTTTTGIDMSKYHRAQFIGAVGTLGSSATIAARLVESDNSNMVGNTNISGASITTINTANRGFTLEVRADQMTKRYCGLVLTIDVASVVAVFPIGTVARHKPVADYNTTVWQRVAANT